MKKFLLVNLALIMVLAVSIAFSITARASSGQPSILEFNTSLRIPQPYQGLPDAAHDFSESEVVAINLNLPEHPAPSMEAPTHQAAQFISAPYTECGARKEN